MSIEQFDTVVDLLRGDGSVIINKKLIFATDTNTAMFYSELMSKYLYFKQKNMLTNDGYFFCTVDDMRLSTGLARTAQDNARDKLIALGLIEYSLKGAPPKRHFKPVKNFNKLINLLEEGSKKIEKLDKKLAKKAEDSRIDYDKRFESNAESVSNGTQKTCNNTNRRILNNNTKTNAFSQGKSVCLDKADEKLNIIFEIYNLLHYFAVKRKELGYETKFTISKWNEYAKKFSQQYSYETSYDKAITFEIDSELIDAYFNRNFSRDIDYNIPHFLQREVLINTYKQIKEV